MCKRGYRESAPYTEKMEIKNLKKDISNSYNIVL